MSLKLNPITGKLDVVRSLSYLDSRYVNVTGDTMTGDLLIKPSTDSLTALVVNDKDANTVFDVDTVNNIVKAIKQDTKANILALTPTAGVFAYSTDTFEFFMADGSAWKKVPFTLVPDTSDPDMGYTQASARVGITSSYITDKLLANVDIGNAAVTTNASATRIPIRASGSTLQIYVSGAWQTIVSNFVFRENSLFGYTLEHMPVGFTWYIEPMSGDSLNNLGLNGLPLIQSYTVSMGSYPIAILSGGRSII